MRRRDRGLTLVELMVSLVLTLAVTLAAASALLTARRGFLGVDAAGQLQDNARFAADFVHRIAAQSGHLDDGHATQTRRAAFNLATTTLAPPYVQGYDDALRPSGALGVDGSRSTGCTASDGKACRQGGDVLVLRAQATARTPGGTETDRALIDCMGSAVKLLPADRTDLSVSVFYVDVGIDGEPSLMCNAGTTASMPSRPQPVVQGVESFQVLYGVDGVTPHAKTPATAVADGVAERYLRADQMVVVGDDEATRGNWQRVRSLRIGMVLRGPAGAATDRASGPVLHPLGEDMASADDPGSRFQPEADGRLRRTVAFTVHLHNHQGLP